MPKPLSPQSLRGDARFDLDAQFNDFVEIVDKVMEFDKAWTAFTAHVLRRCADGNRKRNSALVALDLADEREAAFNGSGLAVV